MFAYQLNGNLAVNTYVGNNPPKGWLVSETEIDWTKNQYVKGSVVPLPVPPSPPVPTAIEIKQQQLLALDAEYQPQFDNLTLAWAKASMDGNINLANSIKADKDALAAEYQAKRGAIVNG